MEIIKRYEFTPDYTNIVKVANNIWVDRIPLYEHVIGENVIKCATGCTPFALMNSDDDAESVEGFRQYWNFWKTMGYDTASYEFCSGSAFFGSGALGGHVKGAISDRADFERYPWDEVEEKFFSLYHRQMVNFAKAVPEGMKAIGGVGNGIFEAVQDIVGYMDLCYIKADDEELYYDIFKAVSDVQYKIWTRFMKEYSDVFCLLRFGDDLGFDTATLISTQDIKKAVIPHYRKITDLVHSYNKPFLLHSCGNLFNVFDDIITDANINAKHSNEDKIAHFSVWVDRYGDRIGNFGGIDTDVLCRYDRAYIREYVLDSLSRVKGKGGIAFSSGNSIPDYVPFEGYLAMVETVREWRNDKEICCI